MIKILPLILLISFRVDAQEYKTFGDFKYCKDTLIFRGSTIRPGDSIRLGFGSGAYKEFLFIFQQTANLKKYVKGIDHPLPQMANVYMILKRIEVVSTRQHGIDINFVEPIFGYTMKEEKVEWSAQLGNAIDAKEISIVRP